MTLGELAAAVRGGSISPVDLVERSLARIAALDPPLGAVVARRDDAALAEAARATELASRGSLAGALAGLPLLVKDTEHVAGMVTTYGSLLHVDDPPAAADDLVVARLRAAGAIVVGKTNTPEFACEGYTSNRAFGATRNPWAIEWSPGGSSGGSAAALAAGLAPIATASDGGGSVRIPAAYCGLVGLKPTNGVIGRSPIPAWIDYSTIGPLATAVDDARLLLSILAGPVAGDPTALPEAHFGPAAPLPRRVLAAERLAPWGPLPAPVAGAFDAALAALRSDLGLEVRELEPREIFPFGNVDEDWVTVTSAEYAGWAGRDAVEADADRLSPEFLGMARHGSRCSLDDYLGARRRRFEFVRALDELLGDDGLLVCPTMCVDGFPPDGRSEPGAEPGTPGDAYNTQAANVTGHPALSVPAGVCPNGVPFGLQITGPRFREGLVLAMGAAWERARPWPRSAPGYASFDAA
jgi:Asp-tRNA(Asn)/Glu-tRNA(Gln) amidotransferase A subunit family amidase